MKNFINFLPPWVETNIQPAFYDKESGSVLQQTARMYAKVNQLVRHFNELSKETQETVALYIKKFTELKDYVEDYFKNLDVQEEINNKLDDMVESGQMSDLIAQYIGLGALVTFDTLADLIASVNLNEGSKCKTLGKDTINDGYGAYYTIGETGDIELANGLFATLVPDFGGNNYYDEITFVKERHYDTDCYFTTIPFHDNNDEEIPLYIGTASDIEETPEKYAQNHFTTFTSNATLNYSPTLNVCSLIIDGEIVRDVDTSGLKTGYRYIGIKDNREIVDFVAKTTTAEAMLASGCKMAWLVYFRIVQAGEAVNFADIDVGGDNIVYGKHPRQCLGQKPNGDIIMLTCGGRNVNDAGLTAEECATLLIEKGCSKAWNLDGGGSASTNIKGVKINRDIDDGKTSDRFIQYTLNVKKETIDKELAKAYSHIGAVKNGLSDDLMPLINYCLDFTNPTSINNTSLNTLTDKLIIGEGYGLTDSPRNTGYFINIPHAESQYVGHYAKQIFFVRQTNQIFVRTLENDVWSRWYDVNGYACSIMTNDPQTIATTNEYTPVTFKEVWITGNTNIFTPSTPDESGRSDSLTVNTNGKTIIRGFLQVEPAGTREVYVRCKVGSTPQDTTRVKVHVTQGELMTIPFEYYRDNTTPSNTFSIEYYGQSGDKIVPKFIVEI